MHYAFRTVLHKRSYEVNANELITEGFGGALGTFRSEQINGFNLSGRSFNARIRNQIEIEIEIRVRIECIMRVDKLPAIYCAIAALRIPHTEFRIPYSVFHVPISISIPIPIVGGQRWFSQLRQSSAVAVQLMRFNYSTSPRWVSGAQLPFGHFPIWPFGHLAICSMGNAIKLHSYYDEMQMKKSTNSKYYFLPCSENCKSHLLLLLSMLLMLLLLLVLLVLRMRVSGQ